MPGIWLDTDTYRQTAGQLWSQQATQQIQQQAQARAQAGQQWAADQIARLQQQAQAQVQQVTAPPPPAPPPPPPAPAPITPPVAATPVPVPAAAPPPEPTPASTPDVTPTPSPTDASSAPVQPLPSIPTQPSSAIAPVTPTPSTDTSTDLSPAGQNWAEQQIQNLMKQAQNGSQTPPGPAAPGQPTPTPSTPGAPAGPQPKQAGDLIDQTRQAATAAGIDPDIFARQINQESGFNPQAGSGAGAQGIAQFMPATAQGLGINPLDPSQALPAAAKLMKSYLDKYGGDWSKALSAYNAGPGNVDQYGGVPPFAETQSYVKNILGGAQDLVQTGQTAVNNVVQGAQAIVARTSQFAMGLSSGDAMAFCGPAAAMAFAQTYGRNPTVDEAKQLAAQVGWNSSQGMAGVGSEVKLLNAMGIDAHSTQGVDWGSVAQSASSGNPVIIDTPGHYFYVDGYNQDTGQFHLGSSATDLKAAKGQQWFTPDQIPSLGMGDPRAAVFADHPLSQSSPTPPGSGSGQSLTMGGNQPAGLGDALGQGGEAVLNQLGLTPQVRSLLGGAAGAAGDALSSLPGMVSSDPVARVQQAVQDVGSQGLNLLGQANTENQQWLAAHPDIAAIGGLTTQPIDPNQPLGPQLTGIDPYKSIVQQGLPSVLSGLQTGDVGQVLGGGLQTLLGAASVLPGTGGEAAAARGLGGELGGLASTPEALLRPADVPWSAASSNLLQQGPLEQQATPAILRAIDDAAQARALGVSPDLLTGQFDDLGRRIPPGMLENPQTSADLGRASYDQYGVFQREPSLFSDRGIAMDPATGQEIVPPQRAPLDFGPTPQPMDSSAVLDGLQQMARDRGLDPTSPILSQRLADLTQQITSSFGTPMRNFLTGEGSESGAANLALMRALGGGAAGGLGAYETTDPNDPNRALKIAGAAGLSALAAGGLPGTSPSGISGTDWLKGYIKGGVIASPLTMADVGINSIGSPILHTVINTLGDVLHGPAAPGRIAGRALGTAQGINEWAKTFLGALQPGAASPTSLVGRSFTGPTAAGNLLEQLGAYGGEMWGMTHGAFQEATQNFLRNQELGTMAGQAADKAGTVGSSAWNAAYRAFMASPPADAEAAAQATGARVAGRADPGEWTSWMNRIAGGGPGGQNTLQAMMFPAYRMGMNWMARLVEGLPIGVVGTAYDVARGLLGDGPYAAGRGGNLAGLLSQPATNTVTPLAQRIAYNAIGTALSYHFIQEALKGNVNGSWDGYTPQEQDTLRAGGAAPETVRGPDGNFYSFDKVLPQLKGPLMLAGAWADAAHAHDVAQNAQRAAGSEAYGLENPDIAATGTLMNEMMKQIVGSTPMRQWSDAYSTLTGGNGLSNAVSLPSSLLGELVPESGFLRGVNQMTDPLQRQTLQPRTMSEIPPAILQNLEKNLPGLSESLPARVDVLGRQVVNPSQGLGAVLHPAAGQPSPVLNAMAASGFAPSATPDKISFGDGREIALRPEEQRAFQQLAGQRFQQMASTMASGPAVQALEQTAAGPASDPAANRARQLIQMRLAPLEQAARQYAEAQVLRSIPANERQARASWTSGIFAPTMGYGPDFLAGQQQNAAAAAVLAQALAGGNQRSGASQMAAQLAGIG